MGLLGAPEAMSPDRQTLDELRIDARAGRRRTSPIVWLVVLLLAGAAAVVWWMKRPKAPEVRTLIVQQPGSGNDRTALNGSGYVTARREATVSSKVTGKVVEALVEEGMRVEAGQVLARIDTSNVEKKFSIGGGAGGVVAQSSKKPGESRAGGAELNRFTQTGGESVASRSSWTGRRRKRSR